MSEITTIFWDVGGVLLTNGWDTESRQGAVERFGLSWQEFDARHEEVVDAFETGELGIDDYIDRVVRPADSGVSRSEFRDHMLAQSERHPDGCLQLVDRLLGGRFLLATLNNESLDLNLYRIAEFDLAGRFTCFFSSCFVGAAKPDPGIYRAALRITQRDPSECLYIDDRDDNLEPAQELGMRTILFEGRDAVQAELEAMGVL